MDTINEYETVLGETFIPPPDEPSQEKVEEEEVDPSKPKDWKPELKKVIQVLDQNGEQHILGFENFKPTRAPRPAREQKPKTDAPKDTPFGDSAMLLKAIVHENSNASSFDLRLEIQSERLRNLFQEHAKHYTELKLNEDPIVIEFPFRCLFFLLPVFRELSHDDDAISTETKKDLEPLLSFIEETPWVREYLDEYQRLVEKRNIITFDLVWMLFPPNTSVVIADTEEERDIGGLGYLVESVTLKTAAWGNNRWNMRGQEYWELTLLHGYHDGYSFSVRRTTRRISFFPDRRHITLVDLSIVPLHVMEKSKSQEYRSLLVERGKRYMRYCESDMVALHYKGPAVLPDSETHTRQGEWGSNKALRVELNERVMIDRTAQRTISGTDDERGSIVASSVTEHLNSRREEEASSNPYPTTNRRNRQFNHLGIRDLAGFGFSSNDLFDDDDDDLEFDDDEIQHTRGHAEGAGDVVFTDDDYFICQSTTIAFALDQKVWVSEVRIAHLTEIDWHGDPFSMLQMPSSAKNLVEKLVRGFNERDDEDEYDDIIKGKGKGLIFLLHGPPGLGKTLTAESVAESAKRPLYRITTGELSTEVSQLEKQLSDIFRLGARWRALVLLDEADVLMAQRSIADLHRNAIVAVFLRLLEYYRGILFLTTNRIDDFDEAFYSRIHVTLQFDTLKDEWRSNIWKEHVRRATMCPPGQDMPERWTDDMFVALGGIQTNGRDIKNYTRTAHSFAQADQQNLTLYHLLVVLENNLPKAKREEEKHKVALDRLKDMAKAFDGPAVEAS